MAGINTYKEYFKIGFKKSIEYKSYIIGALTTPVFMGIFFYFIWSYIYAVKGGGDPNYLIAGLTFKEMIVYLIIGLLINTARSSDISNRISEIIKSGDVAIFLCRPVNFVKSLLADGVGGKVIPLFMFTILLIIMTKVFGLPYPTGGIFVIFMIYAVLMLIFDIVLYVTIGGLSFWFVEIWGIRASIEQILWILSGRTLPLNLFPIWMQTFMAWTPFMYLEYTFARIYLGKLSIEEALRAMGIFMIWIVLMILLMKWVYARGFKKLESFGG